MNIRRTIFAILLAGMLAAALTARSAPADAAPSSTIHTSTAAFTTPSGNIGCLVQGDVLVCTVIERHWNLSPLDCETGFSDGVVVISGDRLGTGCIPAAAQRYSAPDTYLTWWLLDAPQCGHVEYFPAWGEVAVLDYGSTIDTGELVITSDRTGVLVTTPNGNQAQIAREQAIIW